MLPQVRRQVTTTSWTVGRTAVNICSEGWGGKLSVKRPRKTRTSSLLHHAYSLLLRHKNEALKCSIGHKWDANMANLKSGFFQTPEIVIKIGFIELIPTNMLPFAKWFTGDLNFSLPRPFSHCSPCPSARTAPSAAAAPGRPRPPQCGEACSRRRQTTIPPKHNLG